LGQSKNDPPTQPNPNFSYSNIIIFGVLHVHKIKSVVWAFFEYPHVRFFSRQNGHFRFSPLLGP
jgi:hypothetical protein